MKKLIVVLVVLVAMVGSASATSHNWRAWATTTGYVDEGKCVADAGCMPCGSCLDLGAILQPVCCLVSWVGCVATGIIDTAVGLVNGILCGNMFGCGWRMVGVGCNGGGCADPGCGKCVDGWK